MNDMNPALGLVTIFLFGMTIIGLCAFLSRNDLTRYAVAVRVIQWLSLSALVVLGMLLGVMTLLLTIITGVVLYIVYRRQRESQQAYNLALLQTGVNRNIPLAPLLRAASRESAYFTKERLARLATEVEAGAPLDEACVSQRACLPFGTASVVSIGLQTGRLGESLREFSQQLLVRQYWGQRVKGQLIYLAVLGVFICGITLFVQLKIFTAMQKIFRDFGISPSWTEQILNTSVLGVVAFWGLTLLVVMLLMVHFFGSGLAMLPIVGRPIRWFHGAGMLRQLASVTEAGLPLSLGLSSLGERYQVLALRWKARQAAQKVAGGADWVETLRSTGVLTSDEVPVVNVAQRVGNLPWTLRLLADRRERVTAQRMSLASSILFPLMMLPFLTMVFLLAFTVVSAMSDLVLSEATKL